MEDRREQILELIGLDKASDYPLDSEVVNFYKAKDAMDQYMKERCLELLEFIANNKVDVDCDYPKTKEVFYYKGEWITKEQLFENFL